MPAAAGLILDKLTYFKYNEAGNIFLTIMQRRKAAVLSAILVLGILMLSGMYLSNSTAEAKRQSQSTTTLCDEETGTCNTTVCVEGHPCKSSQTPPSNMEPNLEDLANMRPFEEQQQPSEEQQQPSDPKEDENEDKQETNRGFVEELLDNPLLSVPQVLE